MYIKVRVFLEWVGLFKGSPHPKGHTVLFSLKLSFFEVNFDGLGARTARDYDLLWHIASFLFLLFLFLSIPLGRNA